jgi:alpha-tubulin suppressor-like RCC1 family protein
VQVIFAVLAALACACGRLGYDAAGEVLDDDAGVADPLRLSTIAAGDCHTCRLTGGEVHCWGCNEAGQLGLGDLEPRAVPTRLAVLPNFDRIWAGRAHSCGLRGGFLWCWGDNSLGQIGLGAAGGAGTSAERLTGNDWSDAALGHSHSCGLRSGGSLWCWGDNAAGQLGLGIVGGDHPAPELLEGSAWREGRAGRDVTCFIERDTSSLRCWGLPIFAAAPAAIDAGVYRRVDVGGDSICAVTDQGALVCSCADASAGCAGFEWRRIGDATDWIATSSGLAHTCGLRVGGSLWCWGENADGQLGLGHTIDVDEPERVGRSAWLAVAAGGHHTCAIRADETTWCWGRNASGQLGQGATSDPVAVPVLLELP